MRPCQATTPLPPTPLLFAILAGQGRVLGSDLADAPTRARCELAHHHPGEHADHVWDWGHQPSHALWARWTTEDATPRYENLPWCETLGGPDDDACTLYSPHPDPHSWNITDPETEPLH
ncbi:hypothetical protein ACIQNU_41460 [Streptomyces sp. NPDC091292]|uniref:hypothetical protein n=1 Tax=Streptomyces sp. NPDC091292 TaxID=3365991 RepID=UPI0038213BE1